MSGTDITPVVVTDEIARFFRRCEAARHAGGLKKKDVLDGFTIPPGWQLDLTTEYFLPPNVVLL